MTLVNATMAVFITAFTLTASATEYPNPSDPQPGDILCNQMHQNSIKSIFREVPDSPDKLLYVWKDYTGHEREMQCYAKTDEMIEFDCGGTQSNNSRLEYSIEAGITLRLLRHGGTKVRLKYFENLSDEDPIGESTEYLYCRTVVQLEDEQ